MKLPKPDHKYGYTEQLLRSIFTRKEFNEFKVQLDAKWQDWIDRGSPDDEREVWVYEEPKREDGAHFYFVEGKDGENMLFHSDYTNVYFTEDVEEFAKGLP